MMRRLSLSWLKLPRPLFKRLTWTVAGNFLQWSICLLKGKKQMAQALYTFSVIYFDSAIVFAFLTFERCG